MQTSSASPVWGFTCMVNNKILFVLKLIFIMKSFKFNRLSNALLVVSTSLLYPSLSVGGVLYDSDTKSLTITNETTSTDIISSSSREEDNFTYGCGGCVFTTEFASVNLNDSSARQLFHMYGVGMATPIAVSSEVEVKNSSLSSLMDIKANAKLTIGGLVSVSNTKFSSKAVSIYTGGSNGLPDVKLKNGLSMRDIHVDSGKATKGYGVYLSNYASQFAGSRTFLSSKFIDISDLTFSDSTEKPINNYGIYMLGGSSNGTQKATVQIDEYIKLHHVQNKDGLHSDKLIGMYVYGTKLLGLDDKEDLIEISDIINKSSTESESTVQSTALQVKKSDFKINRVNVTNITATGQAVGLDISDGTVELGDVSIKNIVSDVGNAVGIMADSIGIGSLTISGIESSCAGSYAIIANSRSTGTDKGVNFGGNDYDVKIEGILKALSSTADGKASGLINGEFLTSHSYFSGTTAYDDTDKADQGTINLSFDNGGIWYVPENNILRGRLSLLDGGIVYLGYENQTLGDTIQRTAVQNRTGYAKLSVSDFSSNNGTIRFEVDINKETDPNEAANVHMDQFSFGNLESDGIVNAFVTLQGEDINEQHYTNNCLIEQTGNGQLTVYGGYGDNKQYISQNGGVRVWKIAYVPEGENIDDLDFDSTTNMGTGPGAWHLVRVDSETEEIPEIKDNITIGTSASQALAYMADLEDLRKRLGEVRYGAQAGAWVKAFAKKDNVSASGNRGFEQDVYGINVGLDTLVGTSESASWLVGGAFRYARADQEGIGIDSTSGDLDEYSIKAYATWMHEKGSYADFVLQAGRYEQELNGLDNTGTGASHADYGTWGFGASIEIGHTFSLADDVDDRRWFNHFFIEPQLELSYFHARGADYSTSTGLKVSQDNADFLTGRAGLVLGKKFNYGTEDELDRRYFQLAVIGGVKHEFLGGDQTIRYTGVGGAQACVHADDIDGTRFYYGLNFDWQVSDSFRLYAQFDREEGDHYTKEYDVSVGAKWSF